MINSVFYKKKDKFFGFALKGHAGVAPYGKDLLCAGVSAAANLSLNAILDLVRIYEARFALDIDDGYIKFAVKLNEKTKNDKQNAFETSTDAVFCAFADLLNDYKDVYPGKVSVYIDDISLD